MRLWTLNMWLNISSANLPFSWGESHWAVRHFWLAASPNTRHSRQNFSCEWTTLCFSRSRQVSGSTKWHIPSPASWKLLCYLNESSVISQDQTTEQVLPVQLRWAFTAQSGNTDIIQVRKFVQTSSKTRWKYSENMVLVWQRFDEEWEMSWDIHTEITSFTKYSIQRKGETGRRK